MKRKLGLAAVIVLGLFLLAACGGNGADQNQEEAADTVTTASIVSEAEEFRQAISEDGTWIIATLNDLNFDEELVVEGTFYNGGDSENDIYRKIAAYAQDDERNVTDRYTITAPQMTINSPNTRFQGGVFEGDIVVEANGFTLYDATVEGNIYFASEEFQESAEIAEDSEVTGEMEVQ
ncbi:hypothetical protein C8C77_12339 [Halanaerobium saccharolyticum]|uniref:Polymer-forming protein n=1 Tax=Halanaerobium saccharolyticum TaxID=43595 RepID=A0A4R7YXU7_9FIRM|nr:hypothetical protein [Halanaerobium saccharolyticum]RAK06501.1 hypothetical protein C7958_12239 [Halanaerobium saccharolyticum]TDW01045.1 hypothetical protein C8C77_12339 [Halanaerobium saccharolyticum]TDX52626.1 hypothetical protein C7956_12239 [Halanaerobium saccharolyticum]